MAKSKKDEQELIGAGPRLPKGYMRGSKELVEELIIAHPYWPEKYKKYKGFYIISGENIITRTYTRDPESGLISDIYTSSADPSVRSEYYFSRDIFIGAKNNRHKLGLVFQSIEIQDNAELMHLLHSKIKQGNNSNA